MNRRSEKCFNDIPVHIILLQVLPFGVTVGGWGIPTAVRHCWEQTITSGLLIFIKIGLIKFDAYNRAGHIETVTGSASRQVDCDEKADVLRDVFDTRYMKIRCRMLFFM